MYSVHVDVGDRVLAEWPAEIDWLYPGTVVSRDGENYEILFDDGDRAKLTVEQMRPLAIEVGVRVYGNWRSGGQYYPGRVSTVAGEAISIEYDDGDKETTTVRMVRVHRNDL